MLWFNGAKRQRLGKQRLAALVILPRASSHGCQWMSTLLSIPRVSPLNCRLMSCCRQQAQQHCRTMTLPTLELPGSQSPSETIQMISRPSKQSSSDLAGIAVHVGDPACTPAYDTDYKAQSFQRGRRYAIHRLMGLALGPQMPSLDDESVMIIYIMKQTSRG